MLSVFLVDDEALIRMGLKVLIPWEKLGFQITGEAANGEEALEQISHENTDLVITDLKMPFMDGLELSRRLKSSFPGIKVIVLTGFDDFPLMQQSIRNGVTDYLLKPVKADTLEECLVRIKKQIEESEYSYPFEIENRIIIGISKMDESEVLTALDQLFDGFFRRKVPFNIACRIVSGITEAINKFLGSEGMSLKSIVNEDVCDKEHYMRYSGLDEVKQRIVGIIIEVIKCKSGDSVDEIILKVKEYIENNYHENISLSMLAGKFFMSPSYLSLFFKNETNENYNEYLSRLRVEKAKKLLCESSISVQHISEMVGYTDSKYFSQLFKKYTGELPSQYRQRHGHV